MKRYAPVALILMLLAVAIWWLSDRVCWLGDDLDYMFRMQGAIWQSWGWIRSPKEFFDSQWTHYLHVNGRFVAHALVQLFNGVLGQKAFAIANSLVYPGVVLLILRVGGARKPGINRVLTATFMLLFGFLTKMMPTCQIGYIWGLGINLLWVGLFLSGRSRSAIAVIGMCLLGLIAGNWQEAYSVGIGGALGVMLFSLWLHHPVKRLDSRQQVMAMAYIIGTASVCLAPSTLSRAGAVGASAPSLAMISPPGWLYALLSFRLLYIFIGVTAWKVIKRRLNLRSFLFSQSLWATAMGLLLVFNLTLGVFGNRQLFGVEMCAAVLTLRLLPDHSFGRTMSVICTATVIGLYAWQYTLALDARRQFEEIERLYSETPDGRVYFDRRRATDEGFTREAKIYEEVVGLYDNDPHHSMMKYLRHRYPKQRPMTIIPYGVKGMVWRDSVWSYAPGHYVIVGHQGDTIKLRVKRFGRKFERPYDFHKSLRGPGDYRMIVVTPTDPWVKIL
ncbi:MAG: hypothetical protein HDS67_00455 [Bacteroidales bacterium]|nr:hypothetical protein [Bacteroidales bacterium]